MKTLPYGSCWSDSYHLSGNWWVFFGLFVFACVCVCVSAHVFSFSCCWFLVKRCNLYVFPLFPIKHQCCHWCCSYWSVHFMFLIFCIGVEEWHFFCSSILVSLWANNLPRCFYFSKKNSTQYYSFSV